MIFIVVIIILILIALCKSVSGGGEIKFKLLNEIFPVSYIDKYLDQLVSRKFSDYQNSEINSAYFRKHAAKYDITAGEGSGKNHNYSEESESNENRGNNESNMRNNNEKGNERDMGKNHNYSESTDTFVIVLQDEHLSCEEIIDYFQEKCRRSTYKLTFFQWFAQNKKYIAEKLPNKPSDVEVRNATIDYMFQGKNRYYWCTEFKPDIMIGFLFFLKNLGLPVNKILDMSAGRGARLVAAAAFSKIIDDSITYIGVDPNDCLHKNYGKMAKYITEYLKLDKFNYKIFNDGFEKIDPKKLGEGFDVMFTSPPYFDLEVYVKGPGEDKQSITGKNSQQWIDDFMIVSMRKIADLLKSGGIMAINIEDSATGATNFIPRLLSGAESIKSLRFAGNIAYARNKPEKLKFHEIWLWQKNERDFLDYLCAVVLFKNRRPQ